jgi:hypothetical protein
MPLGAGPRGARVRVNEIWDWERRLGERNLWWIADWRAHELLPETPRSTPGASANKEGKGTDDVSSSRADLVQDKGKLVTVTFYVY